MAINLVQGKQIATASWAINALTASYLEGYISPFPFTGSALITGSLGITGSLNVSEGITGSLFGTSSWAENALTASYLNTLNQDLTFNGNLTLNGTASIAFLNVTIESASVIYSSGSNQLGDATNDTQTLIGTVKVSGSQQITGSLNVTQGITGSLFGTSSFAVSSSRAISSSFAISSSQAQNSISSSYPLAVNGTTLRSTYVNGGSGASTTASIFIGANAGLNATTANQSNFIGDGAGNSATNANNSNFFGFATGYQTNAFYSNFFGSTAGYQATNAFYSNFFGRGAGYGAISASYSTLIGLYVGADLVGNNSIGSNNIIIGTNITLASQRKDSINLGGIIFATGSYSTPGGNPYSGSQYGTGRVGINVVNPSYTLEVGGTVAFPNIPNAAHPDVLYRDQITGQIGYAAAPTVTAATVNQINTPDNTTVFIRPDELEQSKYATHNIYNNLNFI